MSDSGSHNIIDYVTIASTGNATDFGNLTEGRGGPAAISNGSRGVFGAGEDAAKLDTIDYITIDTIGNAVDFGECSAGKNALSALSGD